MIRFYYRAGSAHTQEAIVDAIRSDLERGEKALLLVPEQQTVAVERRMLAILPPKAQLHFEVINFSRLANRVFRELGGHSWNVATPAVKALCMWQSLKNLAPLLSQYGKNASHPKLCELMLQTAERCHAYRITADDLLRTAEGMPEGDPLREKLLDLGTVMGTFEHELCTKFDNNDNELDRLCDILTQHAPALFGDTHIYLDSFTDFTAQELAVLRPLMAAAPTLSVTLPLADARDEGLHLLCATNTHKQLTRMANELSVPILMCKAPHQKADSAAAYLAEHLFDMTAEPAPLGLGEQCNVTLTACATPFSQADAICAEIHRLVRGGARYRDIAVVLRDATTSIGILDAALEREGIPFFLAEKTDITVRPLIKLILLALRIRLQGWRHDDVIAYLKTGLCGVSADDVNLLEEYANVWHPRGEVEFSLPFTKNPDGYVTSKSERAERILAGANRAREATVPALQRLFSRLDTARSARDMCRAIYTLLCELDVSEQLKKEAALRLSQGERREAEELSRLYTVTVESLEALDAALGESPLTTIELYQALKLVFAGTDIGTIPTSADEVTVGSASMLRTDRPRFVLVAGLNEGEFPRAVGDDGLISENEKQRLADFGLELPSGRAERASDELFYLYRAIAAPSDALFLFYTKSSADGRACTPSIAVDRTLALLPNLSTRNFEAEPPENSIYTPAALLDRLCEFSAAGRASLEELMADYRFEDALRLNIPVIDQNASIAPKTAQSLFENARLSPSHLEGFSRCRFAYYCDRILHLREEKKGALNLADTGTFLHYILEEVMLQVKQHNRPFTDWSESQQQSLVRDICERYRADLLREGAPLTPRAEALLERIVSLAGLVVANLFEEFADSSFIPALTEFDLNTLGERVLLHTDGGNSVALSGKADRLDLFRTSDGEAYLRVVDYKTGTRKFSPEDIKHGYSLQMPLYLRALCARAYPLLNHKLGLPPDTVLRPAGVTYFSSAVKSENTAAMQQEPLALSKAKDRLERSGVLLADKELLAAASHSANSAIVGEKKGRKNLSADEFDEMFKNLDDTLCKLRGEMQAGRATALPNQYGENEPCKYCTYAAVCRAAQKRAEGDEQ